VTAVCNRAVCNRAVCDRAGLKRALKAAHRIISVVCWRKNVAFKKDLARYSLSFRTHK
jgi:hypothetical protein